jgi:hypothetical protein
MKKLSLSLFLLAMIALAWLGFNIYRKVYVPFQGYAPSAVVQIDSGISFFITACFLLTRN